MASNYETPIENFLEKAIVPKPIPAPRLPPRVIEKVPRKSRARPKPPQPTPTPADPAADPEAVPTAEAEVKRATPRKKRPAAELEKDETVKLPKAKKPKPVQPPIVVDEHTIQLLTQEREEREKCVLSMLQASQGVLEIDIRFDELYKSHVEQNFPEARSTVDYKTLVNTFDVLEAREEVGRIMLSVNTLTGRKLYKSVLTLPGLDLETNSRIRELKEGLQQEAMNYKATPLEVMPLIGGEAEGPTTPDITVEVVKVVPTQRRDLAPIPAAVPPKVTPKKEKKERIKKPPKPKTPKKVTPPILGDDDIPPEPAEEGIPPFNNTCLIR